MREKLVRSIKAEFRRAPRSAEAREMRDELMQNCLDHYDDEISAGKTQQEAYESAMASMGDIAGLVDSLTGRKPNGRKAIIIGAAILALILLAAGFASEINWENIGMDFSLDIISSFADSGDYNVGGGSSEEKVEEIEVNWSSGRVFIGTHDGSGVDISEGVLRRLEGTAEDAPIPTEYAPEKADDQLRWKIENGKLSIHERRSGLAFFSPGKALVLLLPEDSYKEIKLNTASADVKLRGMQAQMLEIDGASGKLTLESCRADSADIDGASGDSSLTDCVIGKLKLDTASGDLNMKGGSIESLEMDSASGSAFLTGSVGSIDFDAASGSLNVVSDVAPESVNFDASSGLCDLAIPADAGFTVKADTASGDVDIRDFAVYILDDGYSAGDGAAKYTFDTASGDIIIRAKD